MKITKKLSIAIICCFFSIQPLSSNPNIILFGLPGAGKGTLSQKLIERYQYAHVCPGNLLRAEVGNQSDFGKAIEPILTKGDYVPEQDTFAFLKKKIMEARNMDLPIIFDGYPRSEEALNLLDSLLQELAIKENTIVLTLNIEKEKLTERVLNRAVCNHCHKVYTNEQTDCDACKTKLERRPQDTAEILEKRINHYGQIEKPLIESFRGHGYQVLGIDVDRDPGDIFNYACKLIDQRSMRPTEKVEKSPKSFVINSNNKDKIDSYQMAKDEPDQRTLTRHTDILEATPDAVLDLEERPKPRMLRKNISTDPEVSDSSF